MLFFGKNDSTKQFSVHTTLLWQCVKILDEMCKNSARLGIQSTRTFDYFNRHLGKIHYDREDGNRFEN